MFMKGESEFVKYSLCFGRIGFAGYSLLAQDADSIFEARIHVKPESHFMHEPKKCSIPCIP